MVGVELLEAERLSVALERVLREVKERPADPKARTLYFELLCLNGDLDRAARQLDVLASLSDELRLTVSAYHAAIRGEIERRSFFRGGEPPRVFDNTECTALQCQAVQFHAAGEFQRAGTLLRSAEEVRGSNHGSLNGRPFSDLRDSNDLTGPVLEAIVDGHYSWIPWEALKSFSLQPPKHLRDLVWSCAAITLHAGLSGQMLVPTLYVGSHQHIQDAVKFGRRTEWEANSQEFTTAVGQKVFSADNDVDCAIHEIRTLEVLACQAPE